MNAGTMREAVNMAMMIDCGTADFDAVCNFLDNNPKDAMDLIAFWIRFNDMTRRAFKRIDLYRTIKHLEACFERS